MKRGLMVLALGCAFMAAGQEAIGRHNAEHYTWGQNCDAWYLVKNDRLTIIEERMPAGTAETLHRHAKARQFFFILKGRAEIEHAGTVTTVDAGTGLEIAPGVAHRILNRTKDDLEFVVTSEPPSHGDRVELKDVKP